MNCKETFFARKPATDNTFYLNSWILAAAFFLWISVATATVYAAEINVFAAASLTDALKEIASNYEKTSGDKIRFNFGASSILSRQIQEGARADLFFSADEAKMDDLEKKGLIRRETRESLLSNTLVIVVAKESMIQIKSGRDLTKPEIKRIALAEPKTVPAGIYAKEYLESIGAWKLVADKVIPTENVRATLAAVEAGNVDAGIVYKTDAAISKKVKVAFEVPADAGPSISYPVAITSEGKHPEATMRFLTHLGSSESVSVFKKYGFIILKP